MMMIKLKCSIIDSGKKISSKDISKPINFFLSNGTNRHPKLKERGLGLSISKQNYVYYLLLMFKFRVESVNGSNFESSQHLK
jgi:hypothetical protein